jgi:hypothetical protein
MAFPVIVDVLADPVNKRLFDAVAVMTKSDRIAGLIEQSALAEYSLSRK